MLNTGTEAYSASSCEHRVGPGADAHGRHLAREHQGGVARRLAARELHLAGAQHDRVAAQLVDAHLEGHARARRGLLEDQGHAAPGQSARGERRVLQLDRAVQQRVSSRRAKLGACEEVGRHSQSVL